MIVASQTPSPIVWDVLRGTQLFRLEGHTESVTAVTFSADGTLIATGGRHLEVKLWDAATGAILCSLEGHTNTPWGIYGVAFSPDNRLLASSSHDRTLRVWDVATCASVYVYEQPAASKGVAFSPDGIHCAATTHRVVGGTAVINIWDTRTFELINTIELAYDSRLGSLAYSADGTRILVAVLDAQFGVVVDVSTGDVLFESRHTDVVGAVAYSPDGTRFATASNDGTTWVYDATTYEQLFMLTNLSSGNSRATFSPDGTHLAVQGIDGITRIHYVLLPDLIAEAQSRLTRTWTEEECQRYLHTDTCPEGLAGPVLANP